MAEINANFVVESIGLTVVQEDPGITITTEPIDLNVYAGGFAPPGGSNTELQYNKNGSLGGVANTSYANGNLSLGTVANIKLSGGSNAYFLQTDGTGNLTWAPGTANVSGNGTAAGANTQIQISDGSGNFTSGPGFTFDVGTNIFTTPGDVFVGSNVNANYYFGNGAFLTGIDTSTISNGNSNVKVYANANVTISSNGVSNVVEISDSVLDVNGNVDANYFLGNGAFLTGIDTSIISNGNSNVKVYANANIAISSNGVSNVVQISDTVLDVNGNVDANYFLGNGAFLTGIDTSLISNGNSNVRVFANSNVTISSNGIANTVIVNGNITTIENIRTTANYIQLGANAFASNVEAIAIGINSYSNTSNAIAIGADANAKNGNFNVVVGQNSRTDYDYGTALGSGVIVGQEGTSIGHAARSANKAVAIGAFAASGTGVDAQKEGAVAIGHVAGADNQGNNSIAIGRNAGRTNQANNSIIINATGANLDSNVANSFTVKPVRNLINTNALFYDSSTGEITYDVLSNYTGNITANIFTGNANGLSNIPGANVVGTVANANYSAYSGNANIANTATTAGTVTTNAQPNITSVGTLTDLTVSNVANMFGMANGTSNIKIYNNTDIAFSAYGVANVLLIGGGQIQLPVSGGNSINAAGDIIAANVYANSGTVSANLLTGTLTTSSQPNITSVGTLTGLTVNGNASANFFIGNGSQLTGVIASSNVANTVSNNAQPNITSVGTLTGLSVNGNITAVNITANTGIFTGNGSGLSALAGSNVTGQVGNALIAGTVYTNAQPNITSVGNLSSLNVTGNGTFGNINGGNTVSANFFTGNGSLLTGITATSANVANTVAIGNANANTNTNFFLTFTSGIGNNAIQIDNFGTQLTYNPFTTTITTINLVTNQVRGGDPNQEIVFDGTNKAIQFNIQGLSNAFRVSNSVINLNTQNANFANMATATYVRTTNRTVDQLAAPNIGIGFRSFVTDANSTTFNDIVGNGGSNSVPVFSDGTNWRIG